MDEKKILIIGCGLIGGSLAKCLKNRLNYKIYAYDINKSYIESGISDGVFDEFINIDINLNNNDTYLKEAFRDIDIVFLCTPAEITCTILDNIGRYIGGHTIVTDVCSTKETIVNHVKANLPLLNFIGGHPMAGSEKDGYMASNELLFENAFYVLTPIHMGKTNNDDASIKTLNYIIEAIGAIPIVMDYSVHDYVAACVSHVPHLVAFALVNTIKDLDAKLNPQMQYMHTLAAGGFKDITRVASSDPLMWQNISITNSENIVKVIDILKDNLDSIKNNIQQRDKKAIIAQFEDAKNYRDSFNSSISGIIRPLFKLKIDVSDRIGTLSKITNILAENSINIKNINIKNNRDFESGRLELLFENEDQQQKAKMLLEKEGLMYNEI